MMGINEKISNTIFKKLKLIVLVARQCEKKKPLGLYYNYEICDIYQPHY